MYCSIRNITGTRDRRNARLPDKIGAYLQQQIINKERYPWSDSRRHTENVTVPQRRASTQNVNGKEKKRFNANPGQKKCNIWSLRILTIFIKHT